MTDSVEEPLPRETGSEKSAETCPDCGTELPVVQTKYGSLITGACPKCSAEQLESQKAAAEAADEANKAAEKKAAAEAKAAAKEQAQLDKAAGAKP